MSREVARRTARGRASCESASLWEESPKLRSSIFQSSSGYILHSRPASPFLSFFPSSDFDLDPVDEIRPIDAANPLFVGRTRVIYGCARILSARFSLLLSSHRASASPPSAAPCPPPPPPPPGEVARRRQDRGCESRKSRLEESPRMSQSR